jgi:hypothetical protein
MTSQIPHPTFQDHVLAMAYDDPHALVLGWGRRLERAVHYFTTAHMNRRHQSIGAGIAAIAQLSLMQPTAIVALHGLRRVRNLVAHRRIAVEPHDAIAYAVATLFMIGEIGNVVPNELAIASGAASVA